MLFDLIIQIHDVQYIQKLTLVLMQTFYLNIKDRTRIYINSIMLLDILCKANFILVFDLHELTSCLFILNQWFQLGDLREICNPAITDLTGDPVCKQRISMSQETSLRDTIRLIVELLRHHLIEIFQFLLLKDLRMKLCNTINREACYDRHICHTNLSIHKDCHFPYFLFISRIRLTNLDHEAAVNLLYDLINTRKQF